MSSYTLLLIVVAFFQSKVFSRISIAPTKPNLGILFMDFFNFYGASKLSQLEISPKISFLPIDMPPVRSRPASSSLVYAHSGTDSIFKVFDPFKEKSNLANNSYKFLYMENLFYFIYLTLHQKIDSEPILDRVFKTAKLFQKICVDGKFK